MAQRIVTATRWRILADATAVRDAALDEICHAAAEAIAVRDAFYIVLAGGTTPQAIYQALRSKPQEWHRWHVWFGDERCLPAGDGERNSRMARDAWLDHVPIPAAQIHEIPGELGSQQGALAYTEALRGVGDFDLVLLGLGEDGHTASLFPGHPWGEEQDSPAVLAVHDAPKPPPERISMSAWRLSAARRVVFLVTGAGKRAAVARWRSGEMLPAAAIAPANGVEVLVEEGAAAV